MSQYLSKEKLVELGFETKSEFEGQLINYVKKIDERRELVICIPLEEIFVWIIDEDAEDVDLHGTKIILDVDDIELAIKIAEAIVDID